MEWKTHTHKHTLKMNSLTCSLEPQSRKKVTGDIKSRSANFKGAPGKVPWKNLSRKKEQRENGSAPHRASCCTIMKHGCNKNIQDLNAA